MEALAFVPLQTCFCHVFCHRLIHVRALIKVCFPLLTWNPLIVKQMKQLTLGRNTNIHHHYKRKYNQPGMIWPADIHSIPCSMLVVLGTNVGYWLHRRATLLPGQNPSQLPMLETCSALMITVLQLPSELVPNFWNYECHCDKTVDKLRLHGLSCFGNSGCFPSHSVINSILERSFTRINLPSTLDPVGLIGDERKPGGLTLIPWYRGLSLVWGATPFLSVTTKQRHSGRHCSNRRGDAATCQNTMTLTTTAFNHLQSKPLVYGKSTDPCKSCLAKKRVHVSGDPRKRQWFHQRLALAVVGRNAARILAYVQVCSDFIYSRYTNQYYCMPLALISMHIYIAFRMFI